MNKYLFHNYYLVIAVIASLLVGCMSAKSKYSVAKQTNTIRAYTDFLSEYPDTKYSEGAQKRIMELRGEIRYDQVKSIHTLEYYERFIVAFPKHSRVKDAKFEIKKFEDKLKSKGDLLKAVKIGDAITVQ